MRDLSKILKGFRKLFREIFDFFLKTKFEKRRNFQQKYFFCEKCEIFEKRFPHFDRNQRATLTFLGQQANVQTMNKLDR